MFCFVCPGKRVATHYRKVGYYRKPGLPICDDCETLTDDEITKKMAKKEKTNEKKN